MQNFQNNKMVNRKISMTYIDATVGNISLPCLIDTGSNHSLLSLYCYKALKKDGKAGSLFNCCTVLKCGSKREIKVIGQAYISIKIGNYFVTQLFIITKNLATSCILGLGFLVDNNALIDFHFQMMYFQDNARQLSTPIYSLMLEFC